MRFVQKNPNAFWVPFGKKSGKKKTSLFSRMFFRWTFFSQLNICSVCVWEIDSERKEIIFMTNNPFRNLSFFIQLLFTFSFSSFESSYFVFPSRNRKEGLEKNEWIVVEWKKKNLGLNSSIEGSMDEVRFSCLSILDSLLLLGIDFLSLFLSFLFCLWHILVDGWTVS